MSQVEDELDKIREISDLRIKILTIWKHIFENKLLQSIFVLQLS